MLGLSSPFSSLTLIVALQLTCRPIVFGDEGNGRVFRFFFIGSNSESDESEIVIIWTDLLLSGSPKRFLPSEMRLLALYSQNTKML